MIYDFTQQEVAVKNLREKGKTYKSIGILLNVSTNRVRQIYVKYKVKEKYNSVIQDFLNGESIESISINYKYPISTVTELVNTFNKKENYASIIKDYAKGDSIEFIAQKNGYLISEVVYIIKKNKKYLKNQH